MLKVSLKDFVASNIAWKLTGYSLPTVPVIEIAHRGDFPLQYMAFQMIRSESRWLSFPNSAVNHRWSMASSGIRRRHLAGNYGPDVTAANISRRSRKSSRPRYKFTLLSWISTSHLSSSTSVGFPLVLAKTPKHLCSWWTPTRTARKFISAGGRAHRKIMGIPMSSG